MRFLPRLDTLFARLMAAQMALILFSVLIMAALSTLERSTLQVTQVVQTWLPAARAALQAADAGAMASATPLPPGLHWQLARPADIGTQIDQLPPARTLKEMVAREGLTVGGVYAVVMSPSNPLITVELLRPRAAPIWVQCRPLGPLPPWPAGITLALGLLLMLAFGVTWVVVRRITRPLEALRQRMRQQAQPGAPLADLQHAHHPPQGTVEIREMDAAYEALMAQLHRHERERALLLAGVSHDLRSPLGRIRLAAEMLPEKPHNESGVASITRNVEHADRLIGSFLDYVRVGMLQMDEHIDLANSVRAAAEAFGRPAHELAVQAPSALWLAQCNALLIDRLVFNLVDNAFKHGCAPVTVRLSAQTDAVLLDVVDQGQGIAAAGGTRLLDAFARGDPSRNLPGVGLGLAVVQQIVRRLQGELQFLPLPDGHAVRITLPQRNREAGALSGSTG